MVKEYNRRRVLVVEGFNYIGLPTFEPRGAFYAFPKVVVTGLDDETFSEKLLHEKHVAAVPGSASARAAKVLSAVLCHGV